MADIFFFPPIEQLIMSLIQTLRASSSAEGRPTGSVYRDLRRGLGRGLAHREAGQGAQPSTAA